MLRTERYAPHILILDNLKNNSKFKNKLIKKYIMANQIVTHVLDIRTYTIVLIAVLLQNLYWTMRQGREVLQVFLLQF